MPRARKSVQPVEQEEISTGRTRSTRARLHADRAREEPVTERKRPVLRGKRGSADAEAPVAEGLHVGEEKSVRKRKRSSDTEDLEAAGDDDASARPRKRGRAAPALTAARSGRGKAVAEVASSVGDVPPLRPMPASAVKVVVQPVPVLDVHIREMEVTDTRFFVLGRIGAQAHLRVFDRSTGDLLLSYDFLEGRYCVDVTMHPDGESLFCLTLTPPGVAVVDIASGSVKGHVGEGPQGTGGPCPVHAVSIAFRNHTLFANVGREIEALDPDTGAIRRKFGKIVRGRDCDEGDNNGGEQLHGTVHWDTDGNRVCIADTTGRVSLFDVDTTAFLGHMGADSLAPCATFLRTSGIRVCVENDYVVIHTCEKPNHRNMSSDGPPGVIRVCSASSGKTLGLWSLSGFHPGLCLRDGTLYAIRVVVKKRDGMLSVVAIALADLLAC